MRMPGLCLRGLQSRREQARKWKACIFCIRPRCDLCLLFCLLILTIVLHPFLERLEPGRRWIDSGAFGGSTLSRWRSNDFDYLLRLLFSSVLYQVSRYWSLHTLPNWHARLSKDSYLIKVCPKNARKEKTRQAWQEALALSWLVAKPN